MAISEFVDGTTPLDASHLNAIVGGVNDLSDQLGNVVIQYGDNTSGHSAISASGGTLTFSGSLALIFGQWGPNTAYGFVYMFRSGYAMPIINTSNITVTVDGTNYSITNNTGTGYRYFLILVP